MKNNDVDTVIVAAKKSSFDKQIISEQSWYFIKMQSKMINKIKYIAFYQVKPIGAITHYALVKSIDPKGERVKRKVTFRSSAIKLQKSIPRGDSPAGTIQGPRYTTFKKLIEANELYDLSLGQCQLQKD